MVPTSDKVVGESPFATEQRGIPLAALFLMTAIVAVLLAIVAIALRSFDFWNEDWVLRLVAGIVAAFCLSLAGAISGLFSHDRMLGAAYGGVAGAIVGLIGAAILYAGEEDRAELARVACGGSVVIILLAAAIRRQSNS